LGSPTKIILGPKPLPVKQVCDYLSENGFRVSQIPVFESGLIDLKLLEDAITDKTILITVMHANNEVGTIQPIKDIAKIAKTRNKNILVHTDAAQTIGKIPTSVNDLGVDLLTLVGHKLYAPKGVGALFVREGVQLEKFMHGASHEFGKRAGTENVILVSYWVTNTSLSISSFSGQYG